MSEATPPPGFSKSLAEEYAASSHPPSGITAPPFLGTHPSPRSAFFAGGKFSFTITVSGPNGTSSSADGGDSRPFEAKRQ